MRFRCLSHAHLQPLIFLSGMTACFLLVLFLIDQSCYRPLSCSFFMAPTSPTITQTLAYNLEDQISISFQCALFLFLLRGLPPNPRVPHFYIQSPGLENHILLLASFTKALAHLLYPFSSTKSQCRLSNLVSQKPKNYSDSLFGIPMLF